MLEIFKLFGYTKIRGNNNKIILYRSDERVHLVLENDTGIKIPNPNDIFYIDAIINNYT